MIDTTMPDISNYSLPQLRKLQSEIQEELKKRHFLGIAQAREQILHIVRKVSERTTGCKISSS
jgi:hypothetical protein